MTWQNSHWHVSMSKKCNFHFFNFIFIYSLFCMQSLNLPKKILFVQKIQFEKICFLLKELFCGPSLHSTSPLALSAGLLTRCFETKSYSRTRRRRPCCHPPPCRRRRCSNNNSNSSSRSTSTWTGRTNFTPRPRATLRRPTIPIRINFLDFIFIFNLIQIIGERLSRSFLVAKLSAS